MASFFQFRIPNKLCVYILDVFIKQGYPFIVQVSQNSPTIILQNGEKSFFFKLVSFFLCDVIRGSEQKLKLRDIR